jgi:ubiquitin C-terminal hydrolase
MKERVRVEDFTVQGLPLPENSACNTGQWSMPELVSNLLQTEVLGGVDALECKACTSTPSQPLQQPQRTPSKCRTVLVSTRTHLVVLLGRFKNDRKTQQRIKRLDAVRVDPTLVLPRQRKSDSDSAERKSDSARDTQEHSPYAHYELYGMVVHSGDTAHSGHYYAIVRDTESESTGSGVSS